ncbi:MAG TPA: hypothetical protein DD730_20545 [Desulfosporosinus sp.]|nr:hypothetical protein [Desulfosporosinus sp.]
MGEIIYLNRDHEKEEALARMMGSKDFDRFVRMRDKYVTTAECQELIWKINSNQIIRLRRTSRQEIRYLHSLHSEKAESEKQLEIEKTKKFKNRFELERLESFIQNLDGLVKETCDTLAGLGELVTTTLEAYNLVASDHDIAQLIGANMREVEMYRKDYEESGESRHDFFANLIFVYQAESEVDQPLSMAMYQKFIQELYKNMELTR